MFGPHPPFDKRLSSLASTYEQATPLAMFADNFLSKLVQYLITYSNPSKSQTKEGNIKHIFRSDKDKNHPKTPLPKLFSIMWIHATIICLTSGLAIKICNK